MVILTIPLADQSLIMNLYKVHNLPALHPKLHVQLSTNWKVNIWQSQKISNMLPFLLLKTYKYVETTERYLCPMNQALYPVDKIEWCVYALYKQNTERMGLIVL